jgi:hypothetical protein
MIDFYKGTFLRCIFILILSITSSNAGLINAISVIVNNNIITLVDIDNKMKNNKVSKAEAVEILIDEILYKQALIKQNVSVDIFDIDNYIELLAKQNKMKVYEFKNAVKQQENYELFREKIRKQIIHQKLVSSIAANNIKLVNDEDMKIYYNNHIEEFKKPLKTEVKVYSSLKRLDLIKLKNNPMSINNNIDIQDLVLEDSKINAQVRYILAKTKEKEFSAIFNNKKIYNMFFVIKKYDVKTIKFKDIKNKIFEVMMKQRENQYLKNYFETLKITADIKVLR